MTDPQSFEEAMEEAASYGAARIAEEIDAEILNDLQAAAWTESMWELDVVTKLGLIHKCVTPVSRKIVSGDEWTMEEFEEEVREFQRPFYKKAPEGYLQEGREAVFEAMADAARGESTHDLHDRVLKALHDAEDCLKLPEINLTITSEEIKAKPRALRATWPLREEIPPSVVERMAALSDPEVAKKVEDYDDRERRHQEMLDDLRDLWGNGL